MGRVLDGILKQVRDHLHQQRPVPAQLDAGRDPCIDQLSLLRGYRRIYLRELRHEGREIDQLKILQPCLRLDLPDPEQCVEGRQRRVDLRHGGVDRRAVGGRTRLADLLQPMSDSSQRTAQFMRDPDGHVAEVSREGFDRVEHRVQVVGEPIELVATTGDGRAARERPLAHRLGGGGNLRQPPKDCPAEQGAADQRERQGASQPSKPLRPPCPPRYRDIARCSPRR